MASLHAPQQPNYVSKSELNVNNLTSFHRNPERNEAVLEVEMVAGNEEVGTKSKKSDVSLTWEDLWVTVSEPNGSNRAILEGLTGYARPGEVLAIMGPSGCGKSTLLDALAGRLDSNTRQVGKVLINGRKQVLAYGTSAYVTQDDTLITTLTVREAVYYSAQLQLPDAMTQLEKKERADMTIREMGLQNSINTRIGGWGAKGLSGGEKRRVSICIEILTQPNLLFLDEPTSGLDSAASYYVMSRIVGLDQGAGRTIITSIHQPSSEIFKLFNNLCLLSSGKTVYFGSTCQVNEFFALNGFPCPTLQNPADHFLKTTNKDFDEDIEGGLGGRIPTEQAIDILTKSYKSSDNYQQVGRLVDQICQKDGGGLEKRIHASFLTQCFVLTKRSFLNMFRDVGYYWLRLAIYVMLALALASVFYNLGTNYPSIQARVSLIMFIATFLTLMTVGGFPSFVEEMKVYERERLNGHYGTSTFVIGNTFSSTPYLLLISIIPGSIVYYITGLHKGYEHFAYFVLVLFASIMLVESLMMIVASMVPNYLMGIITGAGIQGLMVLAGGFFQLPNDLPKLFWRYPMSYVAFHKYAYQGLYKNEFQGLTFAYNDQAGGPMTLSGEEIMQDRLQVEMGYSKWVNLAILFGMVVLYRLLFLSIIKAIEKVKLRLVKAFKKSIATVPY